MGTQHWALGIAHWALGIVGLPTADSKRERKRPAAKSLESQSGERRPNINLFLLCSSLVMISLQCHVQEVACNNAHKALPMHARNLIRNRSVSQRSVLAFAEAVTASIYNYFAVTTQLPHCSHRITIWEKPSRGTIRRTKAII